MKLEHTTTHEGDTFEITDTHGSTISLSPEDALLVCDWINSRRGEIYALMHPEIAKQPPTFMQQTRPDEQTRFRASWIDDLEA